MSSGHGPVIEHKTYVAAHCIRCSGISLRVCIVHNACEMKHDTLTCDRTYSELRRTVVEIIRAAKGTDFQDVLTEAIAAEERIKARG